MFYDVIIVGAGPCGLAAAARLREKTPTALFTNDEHARFWKSHRQHRNSLEQELKRRKPSVDSGYSSDSEQQLRDIPENPSIIVLDANSNQWMSTWNERFAALNIESLRSPLFFHPDPSDRDGLLAFAYENDRAKELSEIPDVVGKELSKHERKRLQSGKKKNPKVQHLKIDGRDQIDYYTPSTKLFDDYCKLVIKRYRLEDMVQQARVLDVSYDPDPSNLDYGLFSVQTEDNRCLYSRAVIVATGPSQVPSIPNLHQLSIASQQHGSIAHVFNANGTRLPRRVHEKLTRVSEPTHILVVGGGLTSAQLVDLLFSRYSDQSRGKQYRLHIHMLFRHSRPKCKPFDIDLPWVSKTRNHMMSTFWSAESDAERMSMFQKARGGGSMTAPFAKKLQKYVADGRLSMHCNTQLTLDGSCVWDNDTQMWTKLSIHRTCSEKAEDPPVVPEIDHIIYCTGLSNPSNGFADIPFLKSLQHSQPMETIGSLPILTEDLAWASNIPCFFIGALAALRLGPGAGNLGGARLGAERIAWAVDEILAGTWSTQASKESISNSAGKYTGIKNHVSTTRKGFKNSEGHQSEDQGEETVPVKYAAKDDRDQFTGSFTNQFAVLTRD